LNDYYETITVAWLLLIDQLNGHGGASWEAFAAAYPELLVSQPSILACYPTDETLRSARGWRVS
jgi:hypothetical protein